MSSAVDSDPASKPYSAPAVIPSERRPARVRIIVPHTGWLAVDFAELWRYRGVLAFLARRDLKVRYAQTALGALWAVFQPVMPTVIFTVVFGLLGKMPSDGAPYSLFVLTALVAWTYFASAVLGATNSLIAYPELVTKVYFPRLALPVSSLLAVLVDFGLGLIVLLAVMLAYRVVPRPQAVLLVPLLVADMVIAAAGTGCWLAALSARYRDVKHVTPVLLQVLMYGSPVVYPLSLIPSSYRLVYAINPMVGVIEGLRYALLGTHLVDPTAITVSVGVSVLLFVSGILYFRRTERVFADFV